MPCGRIHKLLLLGQNSHTLRAHQARFFQLQRSAFAEQARLLLAQGLNLVAVQNAVALPEPAPR